LALDGSMVLYAPEPVWDLSDDLQVVWGLNNSYRLSVYSGGRTVRVFGKPVQRYSPVEADREAELSVLEERWVDLGLTAVGVERLRSGTQFSDLFPAFQSVAFGPAGTIWVQHPVPPSELSIPKMAWLGGVSGGREWDVFDSEGRFLGLVEVSEPFFPLVFQGSWIYGVWNNADQPHVARLRIVGDLGPAGT